MEVYFLGLFCRLVCCLNSLDADLLIIIAKLYLGGGGQGQVAQKFKSSRLRDRNRVLLCLRRAARIVLHIDCNCVRSLRQQIKSEYRPQAGGLLSNAPSKGAVAASFFIRRRLLCAEVLLHPRQLDPHRRHRRAPCPEVFAHAVPALLRHAPRTGQSPLALQHATP